jgi:hypothetical protein
MELGIFESIKLSHGRKRRSLAETLYISIQDHLDYVERSHLDGEQPTNPAFSKQLEGLTKDKLKPIVGKIDLILRKIVGFNDHANKLYFRMSDNEPSINATNYGDFIAKTRLLAKNPVEESSDCAKRVVFNQGPIKYKSGLFYTSDKNDKRTWFNVGFSFPTQKEGIMDNIGALFRGFSPDMEDERIDDFKLNFSNSRSGCGIGSVMISRVDERGKRTNKKGCKAYWIYGI